MMTGVSLATDASNPALSVTHRGMVFVWLRVCSFVCCSGDLSDRVPMQSQSVLHQQGLKLDRVELSVRARVCE
jgi:hypothetical protein